MQETSGLYQTLPGLYWIIASVYIWVFSKTKDRVQGNKQSVTSDTHTISTELLISVRFDTH